MSLSAVAKGRRMAAGDNWGSSVETGKTTTTIAGSSPASTQFNFTKWRKLWKIK